jgi:hypothetical protein
MLSGYVAVVASARAHSQLAQVVKELRNTSYRYAAVGWCSYMFDWGLMDSFWGAPGGGGGGQWTGEVAERSDWASDKNMTTGAGVLNLRTIWMGFRAVAAAVCTASGRR